MYVTVSQFYIMYIVLKSFVLYSKNFGRLKFRKRKNFLRFYYRTLFLPEIKIVRNFLQIM